MHNKHSSLFSLPMSDSMFDGANLPTINIYTVITNYSQDISKNLLNFIPPSRSTIKGWLMGLFQLKEEECWSDLDDHYTGHEKSSYTTSDFIFDENFIRVNITFCIIPCNCISGGVREMRERSGEKLAAMSQVDLR